MIDNPLSSPPDPVLKDRIQSNGNPEGGVPEVPLNFAERIFAVFRILAPMFFFASIVLLIGVLVWVEPEVSRAAEKADAGAEGAPVEQVRADSQKQERAMYSAEELRLESQFREALIEERGGRVALAGLKSLRFSGTTGSGKQERDVSILTMVPDRILIRVSGQDEELSLGYDGKEFWKVLGLSRGSSEARDPNPVEKDLLLALGGVHGPLLREFLGGHGRVVSVEDVSEETGRILRVQFVRQGQAEIEVIDLDPLNLCLLRWKSVDAEGSVSVLEYSGYEKVNGFYEPSKIEFWRNGDLELQLFLDKVVPNFGAVSLLFRNPLQS